MPAEDTDVCFVIRSLEFGGAQRQLLTLAKGLAQRDLKVSIVILYEVDGFEDSGAWSAGVNVISLAKRSRWDFSVLPRAVSTIRSLRPRVVYSMLVPANLLCLVLAPFFDGARLVWGIRESGRDLGNCDWLTRFTHGIQFPLSRFVGLTIFNSHAGAASFASRGFRSRRSLVVPNGIDCDYFRPDRSGREALRLRWGFAPDAPVFALVGNLAPGKGHRLFLEAGVKLLRDVPGARFVILGGGTSTEERNIGLLAAAAPPGAVVLAGTFADMPRFYGAIDALVLASESEGFPNVVGEAMACGVPCVVTDVGDTAEVVGDTGIIINQRTPTALTTGMLEMLDRLSEATDVSSASSRRHIIEHYGAEAMVNHTQRILEGESDANACRTHGPRQ